VSHKNVIWTEREAAAKEPNKSNRAIAEEAGLGIRHRGGETPFGGQMLSEMLYDFQDKNAQKCSRFNGFNGLDVIRRRTLPPPNNRKANRKRADFMAVSGYDGTHFIYEACADRSAM
jgi:hypothetical protein